MAREAAYRRRPDVQEDIRQLEAERQQVQDEDRARSERLGEQAAEGVPGAQEALNEEMVRQAIWTDPPEPSAKDESAEWEAFFSHFYGREMPLNAAYEAEQHRIDAAAPPDVGGLRAAYDEANYPRGYDWDELAAEREDMPLEQYRAAWYADTAEDNDQDQVVAGEPPGELLAFGRDLRKRAARIPGTRGPASRGLEWPGSVHDAIAAVSVGGGAVSRVVKAARRTVAQVWTPRRGPWLRKACRTCRPRRASPS